MRETYLCMPTTADTLICPRARTRCSALLVAFSAGLFGLTELIAGGHCARVVSRLLKNVPSGQASEFQTARQWVGVTAES